MPVLCLFISIHLEGYTYDMVTELTQIYEGEETHRRHAFTHSPHTRDGIRTDGHCVWMEREGGSVRIYPIYPSVCLSLLLAVVPWPISPTTHLFVWAGEAGRADFDSKAFCLLNIIVP